jgi:Txe/YoeB family toxin of Txe-Axe toxin-antitoxin module
VWLSYHREFREDLRHWVKADRSTAVRLLHLVEAVMRDPFKAWASPNRFVMYSKAAGPGASLKSIGSSIA